MERNLYCDLFMENLRRSADSMERDELLMLVHHLTHAYTVQRSATDWAINEAIGNGRSTRNSDSIGHSAGS
jgi:hypothetical protein